MDRQCLGTWYGPVGSSTDHLLDQNSVDRVFFFTCAVALRRLHINERLLMDRDNLNTQTDSVRGNNTKMFTRSEQDRLGLSQRR